MNIRISGEGYEWVAESKTDTPVYLHRLTAVAEYGFDAVADNDVHHVTSVPWLNYGGNLEVQDPYEHRVGHLKDANEKRRQKAEEAEKAEVQA